MAKCLQFFALLFLSFASQTVGSANFFKSFYVGTESGQVSVPVSACAVYERLATKYIRSQSQEIDDRQSVKIAKAVESASSEFSIDPFLLLALIKVESNFDQDAIGSRGSSRGLVQVIPHWHRDKIAEGRSKFKTYSLFDIDLNTWLGANILKNYLALNGMSVHRALVKYNASEHAEQYAKKVLYEYQRLKVQSVSI
jgi:soluble lytic murein transglycosylase-like protein